MVNTRAFHRQIGAGAGIALEVFIVDTSTIPKTDGKLEILMSNFRSLPRDREDLLHHNTPPSSGIVTPDSHEKVS